MELLLRRLPRSESRFSEDGAIEYVPVLIFAGPLVSFVMRGLHGGSNESAAVANLRTINIAEVTYKSMPGAAAATARWRILLLPSCWMRRSTA
jgi:hypothetical protein